MRIVLHCGHTAGKYRLASPAVIASRERAPRGGRGDTGMRRPHCLRSRGPVPKLAL